MEPIQEEEREESRETKDWSSLSSGLSVLHPVAYIYTFAMIVGYSVGSTIITNA